LTTTPPLTVAGLPVVLAVNPRARRISLRLCSGTRTLRLTLPPRASRARALAFLAEQEAWIARQAAHRLPPATPFRPGLTLPVNGTDLLLAIGTGRRPVLIGHTLHVPGTGTLYAGRVRRWLVSEALATLEAETRALAPQTGKPVRSVKVGDFRSRWGSCAPDGRIAYNWRLILAPPHVRHAVVAHEVAHLAEPNHSPRFWALAESLLGTPHTQARAWLRAHGPSLHGYGVEVG
jgi:predicted metal-dependent hydrolase